MAKIKISKHKEAVQILRRLFVVMTSQLDMIEARHKKTQQTGAESMTAIESEKEARTLGSLTKQLENMMALEARLNSQKGAEGKDEQLNTEQLRKNLTQRLTKFEGLSSRGE